jgi:hypothetical protein
MDATDPGSILETDGSTDAAVAAAAAGAEIAAGAAADNSAADNSAPSAQEITSDAPATAG